MQSLTNYYSLLHATTACFQEIKGHVRHNRHHDKEIQRQQHDAGGIPPHGETRQY